MILGKCIDGNNHDSACQCTDNRRRYPIYKHLDGSVLRILLEIWRRDYREKVTWKKRAGCCNACAGKPCNKISYESHSYHYRAGCDHGNSNSIEKLMLIDPMVIGHSSMQERDDRESAPKYKCPSFGKEHGDLRQCLRIILPKPDS